MKNLPNACVVAGRNTGAFYLQSGAPVLSWGHVVVLITAIISGDESVDDIVLITIMLIMEHMNYYLACSQRYSL